MDEVKMDNYLTLQLINDPRLIDLYYERKAGLDTSMASALILKLDKLISLGLTDTIVDKSVQALLKGNLIKRGAIKG